MRRIAFELEYRIVELINVPMFDDTQCYMVSTISNDKIKNNYKKLHISSFTSTSVPIKNHKVNFGNAGIHKSEFRLQAQSNSKGDVLSDKWLSISFMLKHESRQELLGSLTLNLTEYINFQSKKELRFLLERSKTNTIVKLNLFIRPLNNDDNINYGTTPSPSSPTKKGNNRHQRSTSINSMKEVALASGVDERLSSGPSITGRNSRNPRRLSVSIPTPTTAGSQFTNNGSKLESIGSRNTSPRMHALSTSNTNDSVDSGSLSSPTSPSTKVGGKAKLFGGMSPMFQPNTHSTTRVASTDSVRGGGGATSDEKNIKTIDTQTMMNDACENAINDTSLLDELINKTYRFTWQLKNSEYEEFTPSECVKDIIEKNGNGWKKNDEGVDMVDVMENEFQESTMMKRNQSTSFTFNNLVKKGNQMSTMTDNDDDNLKHINFHGLGEYGKSGLVAGFEDYEDDEDSTDTGSDDDPYIPYHRRKGHGYESDDDSSDIFNTYYRGNKHKNSRVVRFRPLTEAEVREDLRSWHISVKE